MAGNDGLPIQDWRSRGRSEVSREDEEMEEIAEASERERGVMCFSHVTLCLELLA